MRKTSFSDENATKLDRQVIDRLNCNELDKNMSEIGLNRDRNAAKTKKNRRRATSVRNSIANILAGIRTIKDSVKNTDSNNTKRKYKVRNSIRNKHSKRKEACDNCNKLKYIIYTLALATLVGYIDLLTFVKGQLSQVETPGNPP